MHGYSRHNIHQAESRFYYLGSALEDSLYCITLHESLGSLEALCATTKYKAIEVSRHPQAQRSSTYTLQLRTHGHYQTVDATLSVSNSVRLPNTIYIYRYTLASMTLVSTGPDAASRKIYTYCPKTTKACQESKPIPQQARISWMKYFKQ